MSQQYTPTQLKRLNLVAIVLSIVIPGVVLILLTPGLVPKISLPFDPYHLPPFYATLNAITAFVLITALYFIKQKNIVMHQRMIYIAMGLSFLFLVGYILYHWSTEPTRFGDLNHDGIVSLEEKAKLGLSRTIYYFLLISHILLSAIVVPFVLFTFVRGFTGQVEKHRKIAKWAFPLWLYVAVTGVICYLMLAPFYPS